MTQPAPWSVNAGVATQAMAVSWADIQDKPRTAEVARRARHVRLRDSIATLPQPIAGYRLRGCGGGVVIELVTSGDYIELLDCLPEIVAARITLAELRLDRARTVLPEKTA